MASKFPYKLILYYLLAVMPWVLFFGGYGYLTKEFQSDDGRGFAGGIAITSIYLFIFSSLFSASLTFILYLKLLVCRNNEILFDLINKITIIAIPVIFSIWSVYLSIFKFTDGKIVIIPSAMVVLLITVYVIFGVIKKIQLSRVKNA